MRENRIRVIINKPIDVVFEFTINPKKTPLWIPSIQEEIAEEFPPKIGTQYKNRGKNTEWDFYKVIELEPNKIFSMSDLEENYHVRYTYKKLNDGQTELEYSEWKESGELKNPFTDELLQNLKAVLEKG